MKLRLSAKAVFLICTDLNADTGDGGKCALVSTEGAIGYWL